MKKNISLLLLFLGFCNALAQDRQIKTGKYDKIQVSGSYTVNLIAGAEGNITVSGEEDGQKVSVETEDNVLKIHPEKTKGRNYSKKAIVITIPFNSVNAIALSGSGNIICEGAFKADAFLANVSGPGKISVNVNADSIEASLSGSGRVELKGTATNFKSNISGSGEINAFDLKSENTEANLSGSGNSRVYSSENLKAKVSGSGNIYYKGDPKKEDNAVSGSGRISKA